MSIDIVRTMTQMAACLLAQIEDDGLPTPCWTGVVPGTQAVSNFVPDCFGNDEGEPDGMAFVRMSTGYPAYEVGLQIESALDSLAAPLGFELEVGIMRSILIPEEGVDPEQSAQAVALQMADMQAMRTAILCCTTFERGDLLLGPYIPFGPDGGVVGGSFQVGVHSP